jgi:DNA primase
VVCEGAFDAMACERAGSRYVAAFNGSKTKVDGWKIMKLVGWGKIILAVDPDDTGRNTRDLIVSMLARVQKDKQLSTLNLPDGLDCDEVWKRNPDELAWLLHEHNG